MSWHAKPSGAYGYNSVEGKENISEMNMFFNSRDYTLEAQAGIFGNVVGESGLNPWRWQSDTVNLSGGYGLFQYTPARRYINGASQLDHYAPNLSVTEVTAGASPEDGIAQCTAFADNTLSKWTTACWRPYWDKDTYAELYAVRTDILNIYGDGSRLTMSQFKSIDNVYYATFAFLSCFEGPAVPNMNIRYEYASDIYTILTGETPIPPVPPTKRKKMPIWMLLRYGL
jgi:hypothetical protein